MRMPMIYLAGGMREDWRAAVKAAVPTAIYLDPTTHHLEDEAEYTAWDLKAVEHSDILFGYFEADNPSGLGLMVEIGVAWAVGSKIILVDEKPGMRKYTGMARQAATVNTTSFEAGVDALRKMVYEMLTG